MFAMPKNGLAESIVMNFDMILAQSLATSLKIDISKFKKERFHRNLTHCISLLFTVFHLALLSIRQSSKSKAFGLEAPHINVIQSIN